MSDEQRREAGCPAGNMSANFGSRTLDSRFPGGCMRALFLVVVLVLTSFPVLAQWAGVPPPDGPRTADGRLNLSAPAPRLPDGKPDLSGIWNPPLGYLRNLAKDLKEEVP